MKFILKLLLVPNIFVLWLVTGICTLLVRVAYQTDPFKLPFYSVSEAVSVSTDVGCRRTAFSNMAYINYDHSMGIQF